MSANEHLRKGERKRGCLMNCTSDIKRIKDDDFLSVEYDRELNKPIKYFSGIINTYWLPINTNKKLWWICSQCNHSWNAERSGKQGCPSCAGKEVNNYDGRNSAAVAYPFLQKYWSDDNEQSPYEVPFGSGKCYHFKCTDGKCNNIHKARLNNKVRRWHCPWCDSGRVHLKRTKVWDVYPNLTQLVSDPKFVGIQIPSSSEIVEWKCQKCAEIYSNKIKNQVYRNKPEYCGLCAIHWVIENFPRRSLPFEEFKLRANEKHDGQYEYDSDSYTKSSSKVRMRHIVCDGDWEDRLATSHLQGAGCPICAEYGIDYTIDIQYYVHELLDSTGNRVCFKGGISNNWEQRFKILKRGIPEDWTIKNMEVINFPNGIDAKNLEDKLKKITKIRHPIQDFPGGHELFCIHPLQYARDNGILSE
ncbi:MAG: zinc-ribbon domain-containing protein [Euryarchaeota archaeon]|nr:zinc-ribbon domain-containing protein [Euryarchaeota archaeon]